MSTVATISERIAANRDEILRIASKHGVGRIRVFGSAARGTDGPESDADFIVMPGPAHIPWFPGGLVADLEDLLGCRVDVVLESAPDSPEKRRILEMAVEI
ncbi:MAG: nucleotidyltransferase domain-containing protein [bacterium]|jgi:hypothetical protein